MAIPQEKIEEFRQAFDRSARPLIFFDGDMDGLSSYALFYRRKGEGKGVMVSGRPQLGRDFARRLEEYQPDAVFILDLAQLTQEFIDQITVPIYWLDHHDPQHPELHLPGHMHYYNPRLWDDADGRPTSYWSYLIAGGPLWLAMTGIIGDYHYDASFAEQLRKENPTLLPPEVQNQGQALFDSPLGELIRILNFNLKGPVTTSMTSVKILTRIETPEEILNQTSPKGKYLYKRYQRVLLAYQPLYKAALDALAKDKKEKRFLIFRYHNETYSLSGELANELKYRFPERTVVIGREHDGKVIMSLRSETQEVLGPLKSALEGLEGYGGGHPKACGAVVKAEQFPAFVEKFKNAFV